jgi:AhpD family alkylhydroperoxidase
MPNIKPLDREELAEFETFFSIMEGAVGWVPSSHFIMGHRPPILGAFNKLVLAVFGPGKVNPALKQLVAMMSSVSAGCQYCQAHTSTAAAGSGMSQEKVEAVFDFESSDLFSDAEKAALRLARDAGIVPNATSPAHFDELRKYFDDEQIVEITAAISIMGWLNRWNDTMATEREEKPLTFASSALSSHGWEIGKHA